MPVSINGNTGVITGLAVGGLPDGTIDADSLASNAVTSAKLASGVGGKILQVVSTTKTSKFSTTTSEAWVDITGLSVSITPTSSSNKILIQYDTQLSGTEVMFIKLVRGSTDIKIGDEGTNRIRCTQGGQKQAENQDKVANFSGSFLDSPNTTSATTYKIQGRVYGSSQYFKVNSANNDSNASYTGRGASTITVIEVAQ